MDHRKDAMKSSLIITATMLVGYVLFADTAKVRALVVDDERGEPLANVPVTAYFTVDIGWRAWTESSAPNKDRGQTDVHGNCRLVGKTNCGKVGCWIEDPPSGYYRPRKGWGHIYAEKSLLGIWQPDNLVATIKLQRIECPIALFVKQFEDEGADYVGSDLFAKGDGRLLLDMMKGEWLPPVGNGEHADVVFTRLPHEDLGIGTNFNGLTATSYRDSMSVSFVGDGNGLVEVACSDSAGLMIRTAPQDGYRQNYLCWKGRMKDLKHASHFDKRRNFAFRIRTRRDGNGKITSAYYGKIYGDINFKKLFGVDTEAVAAPSFLYYLNLTPNDRNLEWDMKTNLCPNPGKIGQFQP